MITIKFFDFEFFLLLAQKGEFTTLWKRVSSESPDKIEKILLLEKKMQRAIFAVWLFFSGYMLEAKGLGEGWQRIVLWVIISITLRGISLWIKGRKEEMVSPVKRKVEYFFNTFCDSGIDSEKANEPDLYILTNLTEQLLQGSTLEQTLADKLFELGFGNLKKDEILPFVFTFWNENKNAIQNTSKDHSAQKNTLVRLARAYLKTP